MSRPAPATTLRIWPNRLALEQSITPAPGDSVLTDSAVTFGQLLTFLPPIAPLPALSAAAGHLLVRSILAGSGTPWQSWASDPWAVRAVHRSLLELRRAGIAPQVLRGPRLLPAVRYLAQLLAGYEVALATSGCMDLADREREAVLLTATGELPAALAGLERIVVEGGTLSFGSRLDLLNAFAARGLQVEVRVPWDGNRRDAFAFPEASLAAIEARAHAHVEVSHDARVGTGPLAALREAQFTDRVASAPVSVWACPGPAEQARYVAGKVLAWQQQGVGANDIAVVTPDLRTTGGRIAVELEAVGIRAHRRCGPDVTGSRASRLVHLTLDLVDRDIPREELVELLSLEDFHQEAPGGGTGPGRLWSELRRTGSRFMQARDFGEGLLALARLQDRGAPDGPHTRAARQSAAHIQMLVARLRAIPDAAPLAQMLRALAQDLPGARSRTLPAQAWPASLDGEPASGLVLRRQAENGRTHQVFVDLVGELSRACAQMPPGPDFDRHELGQTLLALAGNVSLVPSGLRGGAVAVLSPDQVVEARFRRLIFAGVDAGTFPERAVPDRVLGEDVRAQINALTGPRLLQSAPTTGRGALARTARDFWLYLEVLAAAQQEVVATICASAGQGAGDRSPLVDELLRSLALREPTPIGTGHGQIPVASTRQLLEFATLGVATPSSQYSTHRGSSLRHALGEILSARLPRRYQQVIRRAELARLLGGATHVGAPLSAQARLHVRDYLAGKIHSVSQLDLVAECRFRFFAGTLLALERVAGRGLAASAREHGTAAHKALELVYSDIASHGGLVQVRRDLAASLTRARKIVDEHREQILAEAIVHPALAEPAIEEAYLAAEAQLTLDAARSDAGEPVAFEYRFDDRPGGQAPVLCLTGPIDPPSLLVRGSIDRIDLSPQNVTVTDYKRNARKRTAGRHLQLPLYTAVAARDFAQHGRTLAAQWVDLRKAKIVPSPDPLEDNYAVQAQLTNSLWTRLASVLAGTISPDPDQSELCDHCDFRALCRIGPKEGGHEPA